MYTTSSYAKELYKKTFTREKFIEAAIKSGAKKLLVGSRFFPERAMYWTRMFHMDAEEAGLILEGIICDSELITNDIDTLESTKSDLLEWIRIAALSRIPTIRIRVDGVGNVDESYIDSLALSLQPIVASAETYGTQLVFSAGTAEITDGLLLILAKRLGYTACRVSSKDNTNSNDELWFID